MDVRVVGIVVVIIIVGIAVGSTRVRSWRLGAMAVRWWRRVVSLTFVLAHRTTEMIVATCSKSKKNTHVYSLILH